MKKITLKIIHIFTGHFSYVNYDVRYLYCSCGAKTEHHNNPVITDWVFPYIDKLKTN